MINKNNYNLFRRIIEKYNKKNQNITKSKQAVGLEAATI